MVQRIRCRLAIFRPILRLATATRYPCGRNGRYARMGNVWQLPSAGLVGKWLTDTGFAEPRIIDVGVTSLEEQRRTAWMTFHSLEQFLNPADHSLTAEGPLQ